MTFELCGEKNASALAKSAPILSFRKLVEDGQPKAHTLPLVDATCRRLGEIEIRSQFEFVESVQPNPKLTTNSQLKIIIEAAELNAALDKGSKPKEFLIHFLYDGEYFTSVPISLKKANADNLAPIQSFDLPKIV